ncbi:hypothetical protein HKCCE3408_03805 [Rhodobacterales bacterium HKCCE3408]|nr:hypothetical protein [Rhodobacterales bacterium HKCCE3408]
MPHPSLDRILAPITPEAFFETYFERRHLVVHRNDPDYFADLLSFEDIDRAVSTMGLSHPEITVTKAAAAGGTDSDAATDHDGARPIGPADYSYENGLIDPVRVARAFADGGTVILSGLQDRLPALGRYTRALEAAISARVQTNIYMTPAGNQGFRPHYDSHDVIVLQISGTKDWRIYDTPVALPLKSQEYVPGTVTIGAETDRFTLHPGDMAYIPRGLAHDAVATDETSIHITTGLMFRTWADVVAEAARIAAHKDEKLRRALPPGFAAPGADLSDAADTLRKLMTNIAEQVPAEAILAEFRDDFVAGRLPRAEGQLSQVARLAEITPETRAGARPDLVYTLETLSPGEEEPVVVLAHHGAETTLPAHAEEPLRHALSSDEFVIADLPGDLDDAGKVVLVRRLVREGLVRLL